MLEAAVVATTVAVVALCLFVTWIYSLLDGVNRRTVQLENRLSGAETRLNHVGTILNQFDTRLNHIDAAVTQVERTLTAMIAKIDGVEKTLNDKIDGVEETLNDKIDRVEETLNDEIDRVEATLNDKIDGVEETLNDKIDGAEETLNDKIDRVEETLNDKIDRVEETLTRDVFDVKRSVTDLRRQLLPGTNPALKNIALVNDEDPDGFTTRDDGIFTYVDYGLRNLHCIATARHIIACELNIGLLEDVYGRIILWNRSLYGFCRLSEKAIKTDPVAICVLDPSLALELEDNSEKTYEDVAVVLAREGPPRGKVAPRRMQFPSDDNHFADKPVFGVSLGMLVTNTLGFLRSIVSGEQPLSKYFGMALMQLQTGFFGDSGTLMLLKNEANNELEAFGVLSKGEVLNNNRRGEVALLPSEESMMAAKIVDPSETEIALLQVVIGGIPYMMPVEAVDREGGSKGVMLKFADMTVYGVFYERNWMQANDWIARYDDQVPARRRTQSI